MREIIKCHECGEDIKEYDEIVKTDDDYIFHKECVSIVERVVGVMDYGDNFYPVDCDSQIADAWELLKDGEFIKEQDNE